MARRKNKQIHREASSKATNQSKGYAESVEYLHKQQDRHSIAGPDKLDTIAAPKVEKVREAISRGSSKSALDKAKAIHKQYNNLQSESLLIEAYMARIDGLAEKGMLKEARSLACLVENRYPSAASLIKGSKLSLAARDGDVSELAGQLRELPCGDDRRKELEAVISKELVDLGQLANCSDLEPEDPLKRAAIALKNAFERITTEPVDTDELMLSEVSRRSPLSDWKYLILAIACFYRSEDSRAIEYIDRIAPESAPAGLGTTIRAMIEGNANNDMPVHVRRLIDSVLGGAMSLRRNLENLDTAFESGKAPSQLAAISRAVNICKSTRPQSVSSLKQYISVKSYMQGLPVAKVVQAMGGSSLRNSRWWQLFAMAQNESEDIVFLCAIWNQYYLHAVYEGKFDADGVEAAWLFTHMADLLCRMDAEELEDERYYFINGFAGFDPLYSGQPEDIVAAGAQSGKDNDYYYLYPEKLYERASSMVADTDIYRKWLNYELDLNGSGKSADIVAEKWHKSFSKDNEPLLYLAESAERRNAFNKALKYLDAAQRNDSLSPKVRKARLRLLFSKAFRHLHQGNSRLVEKDIEEISQFTDMADNDRPALICALRWAQATILGAKEEIVDYENQLSQRLGSPQAAKFVMANFAKLGGLYDIKVGKKELKKGNLVQAVATACNLAADVDIDFEIPPKWQSYLLKEFKSRKFQVTDSGSLVYLCRTAIESSSSELAFIASGAGLRLSDQNKARFMMLRAQSIPYYFSDRRLECFAAAAELARRQRDMELVSEIVDSARRRSRMGFVFGGFGPLGPDDLRLDEEELESVIKNEVNASKFPSYRDDYEAVRRNDIFEQQQPCMCPQCRRARGEASGSKAKQNKGRKSSDAQPFLFEDIEDEYDDGDDGDDEFFDGFDDELSESDMSDDILKLLFEITKLAGDKPPKEGDIMRVLNEHPELMPAFLEMTLNMDADVGINSLPSVGYESSQGKPRTKRNKRRS